MSDKIVVMRQGVIEQMGSPEEVYNEPRTGFVAGFLGHSNILPGAIVGQENDCFRVRLDDGHELLARPNAAKTRAEGERVRVVLRAEKLLLRERHEAEPGDSIFDARVTAVDYQGQLARYFVDAKGTSLQAINPIDMRPFDENANVQLRLRARDCVLLDDHDD